LDHVTRREGTWGTKRPGVSRVVEKNRQPLADFTAAIAYERTISTSLGGRTVFDDVRPSKRGYPQPQISLFSQ
jgi:hypothetical protein